MQSTMMRSTSVQSRTSVPSSAFKAPRACPKARKQVVVTAQADNKVHAPAKAASALLAAVAAAQFALTGAAQAIDPPVLGKGAPQILSPKDAKDQQTGKGQKPSSKYVEQAKQFTSDTAADKIADAPTINKKGGGVGRADFAPSQQPAIKQAAKDDKTPMDVRGAAQANLPQPGGVSKVAQNVGKGVVDKLPNAPDISNPKAAEGKPTASKLTQPKQGYLSSFKLVADVADAPLGDNKPNFPTPDTNPSNNQDVFKQLGDKIRGSEPNNIPSPGKVGEGIASNVNGPDPKEGASQVSKNLPNIAQKTDIAPENVGAKANVRN